MNRWDYYVKSGSVHRDWRSLHQVTSLSLLWLWRGEMKKKAVPKKSETKKDVPIVVNGVVLPPREHDDFIGRDPRSVR